MGVPSSRRIVEDMTHISNYSVLKRYSVCGVVVHGYRTCRGCRFHGDSAVKNRGGQRTKKPCSDSFIHEDAISAVEEGLVASSARWIGDDMIGGN